jgi:hypothetical protein
VLLLSAKEYVESRPIRTSVLQIVKVDVKLAYLKYLSVWLYVLESEEILRLVKINVMLTNHLNK